MLDCNNVIVDLFKLASDEQCCDLVEDDGGRAKHLLPEVLSRHFLALRHVVSVKHLDCHVDCVTILPKSGGHFEQAVYDVVSIHKIEILAAGGRAVFTLSDSGL